MLRGVLTVLAVVGAPVAFVLFFVVVFFPEAVAAFLGPRLSAGLLGLGLFASGAGLTGWLLYVHSTRGRQSSRIWVVLAAGIAVGLMVVGMWLIVR